MGFLGSSWDVPKIKENVPSVTWKCVPTVPKDIPLGFFGEIRWMCLGCVSYLYVAVVLAEFCIHLIKIKSLKTLNYTAHRKSEGVNPP